MLYRFAQFELDTEKHSLRCDQDLVQCDERAVKLLMLLVETAPEPLSQQQLLDALWPETVVSNWSVSRLISDTRKLLTKYGADFSVIQTVHGRGYRLASDAQERLQIVSESDSEAPMSRRSASLFATVTATVLVTVLFGLVWQFNNTPTFRYGESPDSLARILWVDDNPDNNRKETRFLQSQQVAVYAVTSSQDALELLSMYQYDVIISDMGRHGDWLAGLKLVKTLRNEGNSTPYLLYTIMPSKEQEKMVFDYGAQGVAVDRQSLYQLLSQHLPSTVALESEKINL